MNSSFRTKLDQLLDELNDNLPEIKFENESFEKDNSETNEFKYEFEYDFSDDESQLGPKLSADMGKKPDKTKIPNMFTETKLSMAMFDTIDLDELLKSVDTKIESQNNTKVEIPRKHLVNNDEIIMKRLADMSQRFLSTSVANETKSVRSNNVEYLDSHSIDLKRLPKGIDGNSVQTRRIDLRSSQQQGQACVDNNNNNEPSLESLLKNLLNTMSLKENRVGEITVGDDSVATSSSDSEDDEQGGNDLWIERYRKQKLAQSKIEPT